jgi:hypothetical protein
MSLQEEAESRELVRPGFGWLPDRVTGTLFLAGLFGVLVVYGLSGKEQSAVSASGSQTTASTSASKANLLRQKLRLVEAMLDRARKHFGGEGWATSQLEIAGMLTDLARTDLVSKDLDGAEPALDEALRLLSELSRSAHVVSEDVLKPRYQKSLEGAEAMRKAFAEVVKEKGGEARSALDTVENDRLIEEARQQAKFGHYDKAAELLEIAHERVTIALSKLRANETLEHRLVFEGPADEYRYERDRYQSSALLVRLMVAERNPEPNALRQVEKHVDTAIALDAEASHHASLGDYATAIRR